MSSWGQATEAVQDLLDAGETDSDAYVAAVETAVVPMWRAVGARDALVGAADLVLCHLREQVRANIVTLNVAVEERRRVDAIDADRLHARAGGMAAVLRLIDEIIAGKHPVPEPKPSR